MLKLLIHARTTRGDCENRCRCSISFAPSTCSPLRFHPLGWGGACAWMSFGVADVASTRSEREFVSKRLDIRACQFLHRLPFGGSENTPEGLFSLYCFRLFILFLLGYKFWGKESFVLLIWICYLVLFCFFLPSSDLQVLLEADGLSSFLLYFKLKIQTIWTLWLSWNSDYLLNWKLRSLLNWIYFWFRCVRVSVSIVNVLQKIVGCKSSWISILQTPEDGRATGAILECELFCSWSRRVGYFCFGDCLVSWIHDRDIDRRIEWGTGII